MLSFRSLSHWAVQPQTFPNLNIKIIALKLVVEKIWNMEHSGTTWKELTFTKGLEKLTFNTFEPTNDSDWMVLFLSNVDLCQWHWFDETFSESSWPHKKTSAFFNKVWIVSIRFSATLSSLVKTTRCFCPRENKTIFKTLQFLDFGSCLHATGTNHTT